jgi:hypothetical protein
LVQLLAGPLPKAVFHARFRLRARGGTPGRSPAGSCELASLDPRFLHPALAFQPELMLLELAPLLGEMPSLMMLEPGRKALGVARSCLDSLFLAFASFDRAHLKATNENTCVAVVIEAILKTSRRKVLLSIRASSKGAQTSAAQSQEWDARKKPSTQCLYPIAKHLRPLFPLEARTANTLS